MQKLAKLEKKAAVAKKIEDVLVKSNGTASLLKKVDVLINPQRDCSSDQFVLPKHVDIGLSSLGQAHTRICRAHFISTLLLFPTP